MQITNTTAQGSKRNDLTWPWKAGAGLLGRGLLFCAAVLVCGRGELQAQEEAPDAEAATEIIESLQGTLGDLSAIRALPPQQRVSWVLNQASERVQQKIIEDAEDQVKEAMDDYAKAAFRAKAFQNIAIPSLKNAAVLGTPVDWSVLETRMASEVDTKTAAYGAAVSGVTIAWDSIEAFSENGAQAGFSKMAAGVYEAVADAYIPGWGWFKLGATLVEALGNYVIGYATDTAREGMLNDLFNMKGDPKGFAQMLRTTPLPDVYAKVDDGWELVAFGRLWNGQGTDAGDEAMKQKLKDTLYNIKAGIAHEVALQQQKDAALQAQFQPYLEAAAQAEARLKALANKARLDAKPMLDTVRAYQRRASQLGEEKAQEDAQNYQFQAQPAPDDPLTYTPLSRGGVLPLFEAACARVSETPGGSFDAQAFYDELMVANNTMWALMTSQPVPPDGPGKLIWLSRQSADHKAMQNEALALRYDADQRAIKMAEAISVEVRQLKTQLNEAATTLEQGLAALESEAAENLREPLTFQRYGYPGFTENWLFGSPFYYDYMNFWIAPADNYAQIARFAEKVEADRETLAGLNSRRRQLYATFNTLLQTVDTRMAAIIPEGCQVFTNTVAGSTEDRSTWGIEYNYSAASGLFLDFNLPISIVHVRPEFTASEFNSAQALAAMRARMAELEGDYDLAQLRLALQRIYGLLEEKFQPFAVASAGSHAYSLMGRVNGLLDYRQPIDQTDLALHVRKFEPVWLAAQTRFEFLQRHPTLIDVAPLLRHGTDLNSYKTMLAADQEERQRAPGQAVNLQATMQQGLDRWTPMMLEMTPDFYEDALGGLGSMLANAQRDLQRARSWSSPTYTLMGDDLLAYIPKVTNLIHQAQAEYARITPWYFKTMPAITASTNTVRGTVGQPVQVTLQADEPGGTFSSPNLPGGIVIDAATGRISGASSQTGGFDALIRYLAPSGISTRSMVHFELAPPPAVAQGLILTSGSPELFFQGTQGVNYALQTLSALGDGNRWVTLRSIPGTGATQKWTDPEGPVHPHRFYRLVWVP